MDSKEEPIDWKHRIKHPVGPFEFASPFFVYGGGDSACEYYEMYINGRYVCDVYTNGEAVWTVPGDALEDFSFGSWVL